MATYSAIATSELAVNKPVTSSLMTRLRDNPIAVFEQLGYSTTSRVFVSAEYAIGSGTSYTIPHGLSIAASDITKTDFEIFLVCKTAELGYAVGDIVRFDSMHPTSASTAGVGIVVIIDSTNIKIKFGNNSPNGIYALSFATGAPTGFTTANWKVIFKLRG